MRSSEQATTCVPDRHRRQKCGGFLPMRAVARARQGAAMPDTAVDLDLRIARTNAGVHGTISRADHPQQCFRGWLELTAAIARLLAGQDGAGEHDAQRHRAPAQPHGRTDRSSNASIERPSQADERRSAHIDAASAAITTQ